MSSPQSLYIFDDFDEATNIEATFCSIISEQQYQDEIRSETDKALGELCYYLDKNPAAYATVLRKRKQEEIENSGMLSFFKSKVKSLVQGEKYKEELVSSLECIQHVEALKAGMCKTFQYSQELKGNVTRHSERLAAKRKAQPTGSGESNKRRRVNHQSKSGADCCNGKLLPTGDSLVGKNSQLTTFEVSTTSEMREHNYQFLDAPLAQPSSPESQSSAKKAQSSAKKSQSSNKDAQGYSESLHTNNERALQPDSMETRQSKGLGSCDSMSLVLSPPPPPPLPANFKECIISCERYVGTPLKPVTNTTMHKSFNSLDDLSVQKLRHKDFSPRSNSVPKSDPIPISKNKASLCGSVENLSAESPDAQFVTPTEGTSAPRGNKRIRSSKSCTSTPKSTIQREILTFSSVKRLKATQLDRSPGLTPLRSKSDIMPSEPLQRALHTAMKRRYKKLRTPSPKNNTSSNNSSFNSIFSSP